MQHRKYTVPFNDPWESLTPAAKKIVAAANHLLLAEGFSSLTYERIAQEAGVNKSSIRYNFGDKSSLLTAVIDAMIHDGCMELAELLAGAEASERVEQMAAAINNMIVRTEAFHGYFDILPHAMREPELRSRLLALYHWWYSENQKWLGLQNERPTTDNPLRARLSLGLGQIVAAVIDGLSIQVGLDPDHFDLGPALDAFSVLLKTFLTTLSGEGADELQHTPSK